MPTPSNDRTVGSLIETAPARRPERKAYEGRFVMLEPLASHHAASLWANARGADEIWDYMPDGPFDSESAFHQFIAAKATSTDPLFWAIVNQASGEAVGYATLMRIDPTHRVIEVGNILFTPAIQRAPGATETMALMAGIVLDELGYRRYEWKCNALNAPSRAAAARLGFTFEGVFRQHMIVKGRNRDTAWFSMLDSEWPAIKRGFELWLSPDNFDADGRQRRSLGALREAGRASALGLADHGFSL